jgi:lipopolysaccharide assembly protein B
VVILPLIAFLLPVACYSGWVLGRADMKKRNKSFGNGLEKQYIEGMRYLISQHHDKALEVFIQLLNHNTDAIEIHFILGELFRQRGEVDRAIRIHQNIIARDDVLPETNHQALSALAVDYYHAGIFDRSERLFLKIDKQYKLEKKNLFLLLKIYQRQKSWLQCVDVAKKIEKNFKADVKVFLSNYYCELALVETVSGLRKKQSNKHLQRALLTDVNSVRANLLVANDLYSQREYRKALISYRHVLSIDVEFSLLNVKEVFHCCENLRSGDEWIGYLNDILDCNGDLSLPLYFLILKHEISCTDEFLNRIKRLSVEESTWQGNFLLMHEMMISDESLLPVSKDRLMKFSARCLDFYLHYVCSHCGFSLNELQWQCPSCDHWSTIRPDFGYVKQKTKDKA